MKILLANPRGFCAGVRRAIEMVQTALARFGPPVYVRHAIVHNRHVIERLEEAGAIFVEEAEDAPRGALLVFSAHGVSPAVRAAAAARDQRVIDATCPLVHKVHGEAARSARAGREILLVGHADHVEVQGTLGHAPECTTVVEDLGDAESVSLPRGASVSVLTQTTLSIDDTRQIIDRLHERFDRLEMPKKSDICYATQNRQDAVKALARRASHVLVIGSPESSNGMRLVETAARAGADVRRVEDETELDAAWLAGVTTLGVTAGAAVPDCVVSRTLRALEAMREGCVGLEELSGAEELLRFAISSAAFPSEAAS